MAADACRGQRQHHCWQRPSGSRESHGRPNKQGETLRRLVGSRWLHKYRWSHQIGLWSSPKEDQGRRELRRPSDAHDHVLDGRSANVGRTKRWQHRRQRREVEFRDEERHQPFRVGIWRRYQFRPFEEARAQERRICEENLRRLRRNSSIDRLF